MKTNRTSLACALILASVLSFATAPGQKVGVSSFQFLKVMPVARATGMGEAYTILGSGAEAAFWNPAGVAATASHDLSTTYTLWLFDTKQAALAYATSLGSWGQVALQFQITDLGTIRETSLDYLGYGAGGTYGDGYTGRTFKPSSWLAGLTYARRMTDHFSAGITVKYVSESLWDGGQFTAISPTGVPEKFESSADAFLFDVGMLYNTGFRTVRVGASVQNFGQQIRFAREDHPAPLVFRLGLAGDLIGTDALFDVSSSDRLTLETDILQPNDYDQQIHVGAEYEFNRMIAFRAGYKWNYDTDGLTFGGGLHTEFAGALLSLDYSFGSMGEFLTNVHRLSLGVNFQ